MLKVGLTGGIASGKSTISRHFQQLGVAVFDTDDISRQLMQPGQQAYQRCVEHFGQEILNDDQSINRALLRQIVFNQPEQKQWLEQLLHPLIREQSAQVLNSDSSVPYAILVVPLMFETGFDQLLDHVIAIDCPGDIQLQRLIQRDGIQQQLAESMIAAQMSNQQRLQQADSVIINADNQDMTEKVQQLHQHLLELAEHG